VLYHQQPVINQTAYGCDWVEVDDAFGWPTLNFLSALDLDLGLDLYVAGTFTGHFATELGERNANKTCTLTGVICSVCYCTGLFKNWQHFVVALAVYV